MTPEEHATALRALRLAIVDDLIAERGLELGAERWRSLDDREKMRRIGEARTARAVLGSVARVVLGDLREDQRDVEARRARRRPVLALVEGSRIVSPDELAARDRGGDDGAAPRPRLVLLP